VGVARRGAVSRESGIAARAICEHCRVRLPGADGQPFTHSAPVLKDRAIRVVFGPGSLAQVVLEARTLGTRIMIISGRQEADAAEAVSAQLGDDLAWRIPEVVQHVPVETAAKAIEAARESRAGVVISIGGGSQPDSRRRSPGTPDCRSGGNLIKVRRRPVGTRGCYRALWSTTRPSRALCRLNSRPAVA
jgi:hypothetical protein